MLTIVGVLILSVLLAIARELHSMNARHIEIGIIIEHYNRRDLRASATADTKDDDFASESITKTHRKWGWVLGEILLTAIGFFAGIALVEHFSK